MDKDKLVEEGWTSLNGILIAITAPATMSGKVYAKFPDHKGSNFKGFPIIVQSSPVWTGVSVKTFGGQRRMGELASYVTVYSNTSLQCAQLTDSVVKDVLTASKYTSLAGIYKWDCDSIVTDTVMVGRKQVHFHKLKVRLGINA